MSAFLVSQARVRELRPGPLPSRPTKSTGQNKPVIYWMSRDQRASDNWALLHAASQALALETELIVVFCLHPEFLGATIRQYAFMLQGLAQVEQQLRQHNIGFVLGLGDPPPVLAELLQSTGAALLVTDFDPLRIKQGWLQQVLAATTGPVHQVDAHNIVPCWEASAKQEYAARTIRPKIHRRLEEFLTDFPDLPRLPAVRDLPLTDWNTARAGLRAGPKAGPVNWLAPGEDAAHAMLRGFVDQRLERYDQRNDPNAQALSDLSPYLHFGQLAPQRVALAVLRSSAKAASREAFLEELIVRRELADNFCFYNPAYDAVRGFPDWARKSLDKHRSDKREHVYDFPALEAAATHDPLWNAAQTEMLITGKMHGYMRMYWAKKILEWSATPEDAMTAAIQLNDTYLLDGRDPNGYTGIAWSIGGVHDRPWFERPVFGQIRYMSATGCARKFNVPEYIRRMLGVGQNIPAQGDP